MTQQEHIKVPGLYMVQKGDTLSGIAQRAYNNGSQSYWMAIYRMNQNAIGDDPSVILPRKSLWIPTITDRIADPPQTNSVYFVQEGDTLSSIAQQTYKNGSELYTTAIYRMNQTAIGDDPNVIQPGVPLYLPPISNPSPIVGTFYIAQQDDTFSSIAQQAYNNPKESKLIEKSKLSEKVITSKSSKIPPGKILFIPFSQQVPGGVNIHPPDNWP
jgi:nucleoid-associated protein YgaU